MIDLSKYQKAEVVEYVNNVSGTPLVSVIVVTYQQALSIHQCLEGVLMQATKFPYEILIGEDASTDGTKDICIEYAKKFPETIKLFLHNRENNINIEGKPTGRFNMLYNLSKAKGIYIAFCEGDDYWTDPLKLQKQVDFLENNPEFGMVHTDLHEFNVSNNSWRKNIWKDTNYFQSGNILNSLLIGRTSMIYACTATIRSELISEYLDDLLKLNLAMGDIFLWIIIAAQSEIGYISEPAAVRRLLPLSATQGISCSKKKSFLDSSKTLLDYINNKFSIESEIYRIANESISLKYMELYHNCDEKEIFNGKEFDFIKEKQILEKYLYNLQSKNRYLKLLVKKISVALRFFKIDYYSKVHRKINKGILS